MVGKCVAAAVGDLAEEMISLIYLQSSYQNRPTGSGDLKNLDCLLLRIGDR